jgi:hypothetical protein
MRTTLPIAQGFYVSDSVPVSAQRCVNWVPSVPQTSTITNANLFAAPGIEGLVDGSVLDECRGAHVLGDTPYFVISDQLVRLNRSIVSGQELFAIDVIGVIEGNSRVFMADNGIQLCIVAVPDSSTSGKSYIFTESPDTLTEITDANFDGPASSVIYIDGYFVFHKSDGKKFFNSPLNEGLTGYDPLDFNVAEADPDQIRGLGRINNQLYVFGSETTQIFRNIGRAPSPFAPIAGATIDVGAFSSQSIVRFAAGLAFVGGGTNQSPSVWLIAGNNKQRLSTKAIDNELAKISNYQLIYSWVYSENGADFLGISTPNTCFVYDLVNGRWHERQSTFDSSLDAYRVSHMVTAYERVLVGDTFTGSIGSLSSDIYTEYGTLSPRFVVSRPFDNAGNPVRVLSIEAFVESGVGLPNDITVNTSSSEKAAGGSDPKITLSWSDDGGYNFDGVISRSMGKIGEFSERPIWNRLGSFPRQRVLKFEVSSPTKATMIKVEADID